MDFREMLHDYYLIQNDILHCLKPTFWDVDKYDIIFTKLCQKISNLGPGKICKAHGFQGLTIEFGNGIFFLKNCLSFSKDRQISVKLFTMIMSNASDLFLQEC